MRLFFLVLVVFLLNLLNINAQINGISATKLAAFTVDHLTTRTMEFEPTYTVTSSRGSFNQNSSFEYADSISVNSSLCWRMSYGAFDWLEVGANVPSDMSFGNLAAKSKIGEWNNFSLGLMAGVGIPFGNRNYDWENPGPDDVSYYGAGIIASLSLDSLTSLDFNAQYQDYFRDGSELVTTSFIDPMTGIAFTRESIEKVTGSSIFLNLEAGHYVFDKGVYLVGGLAYQSTIIEDQWSAAMTGILGISVETAERFVVVPAFYYNFWGKEAPRSFSVGLSITTILD